MTKTISILHSNDLHADLFSEHSGSLSIGGMELLSGFIQKRRIENPSTFYLVAGDVLHGSFVDNYFLGFPAIESLNRINPDVFTIGNHELDYGIKHMLLLEKFADFPIINANVVFKYSNKKVFKSHIIIEKDNLKILVIGVLTEEVKKKIARDDLIREFIDIRPPLESIEKICNTYKNQDIDLTVLLTHLGLKSDIELARSLRKEWGIDLIIGGHSHSNLNEPVVENGILIVHAGEGSNQIGELEVDVDRFTNTIASYRWNIRSIRSDEVEPDKQFQAILDFYRNKISDEYTQRIGYLGNTHTHPSRDQETTIGNLFCDAAKFATQADCVMFASGSIRTSSLPIEVLKSHLIEAIPNDYPLFEARISGSDLTQLMQLAYAHHERHFLQLSEGTKIVFDFASKKITLFEIEGQKIDPHKKYRILFQPYQKEHLLDMASKSTLIDTSRIEITESSITSLQSVIAEYISNNAGIQKSIEGRILITNNTKDIG